MKTTKQLVAAITLLILSVTASAQNLSNKGTDFWVGYGHHQFMEAGQTNSQEMVLYFAADEATTVTVSIWGTAWTKTYNVSAGAVVASDLIPKTAPYDARLISAPCSFVPPGTPCGGEGTFCNKAIHITSTKPVVAYAHIYGSASSGATMLMPTDTWGYSYISVNSEQSYATNCFSWLYVIAKEDNTVIEVTPSVATRNGSAANTPFTVTLNKGCIYQTMAGPEGSSAKNQMTGSKIRSVANSAGQCFPVAVFSGSSRTANPTSCGSGGGDNDNQQLFPSVAWGKRYFTAPLSGSGSASALMTNSYKVVVKDPTTVVKRNGVVLTGLLANSYYFFISNTADYIEADKPIMIAQFMTGGTGCLAGPLGDPEMIIISPIEQGINKIGFYRNSKEAINVNYLTLIVPTPGLASLRIDGSNAFDYTYPNSYGYTIVVKKWSISAGQGFQSTATCDSAFTAVTYGLGSVESYGYNAGTLINNLAAKSVVYNQGDPSLVDTVQKFTCKGTPVKIKALVGYKPTNMLWRLSQVPNMSPNTDINIANPVLLDSVKVGLAYYYRYELPGTYTFSDTGTFYIPIINTEQTIESCTHTEEVKIAVVVKPAPYTNLTINHSGCLLDTVYFSSSTNGGNGHTVYKWEWNLGDGTTAVSKDTVKLYAAPGTYTITLKDLSKEGCVGDTSRTITIGNKPVASIVITPPSACPGALVVFTDTSATATAGTWYWNFGNSTSATLAGNTPQTVTYAAAGTYTIKHVYKSSATCVSDTTTATIVVNPKPAKPVVTTPLGYCQNDVASPLAATALAGHTLAWYTAYPLTGGSAMPPTPSTAAQGTTQYYVTQTSPSGCVSDTSIVTVNVTPALTGNTVSASQTLCSGSPAAALTGTTPTGGSGAGSYNYQWQQSTDGGATWTAVSGATGQNYSPGVLSSGTTKFRRVVSSGLCSNISNVVDIVVQTNLANYDISASQTICENSTPALLNGQQPTGGTGSYTYVWEMSINGGATWTVVGGATNKDYQPPVLTATTHYRRTTTGGNCPAISNVVIITVNPTPAGAISPGSGNVCQTQSGSVSFNATIGTAPFTVSLLVTPSGGSAAPYTVTQSVASSGPVTIPVIPVNSAGGTYVVTLTSLSDAGNCTRTTGFAPVTINVTATPVIVFTPAAAAVCAGASTTLSATGATSYAWSPATGLSAATGATVTANPAATTTYTATGTTNGCSGTGTITVTVNPLPAKPVAAPQAITYCQNTTATALTATALPGHTLSWYNTYPLTGGSATAPVPPTATAGTFTYYVTQTVTATGCVSDTAQIQVTVTPALAGNTVSAAQTVCAGTAAAALTGGAVSGGTNSYTYQWQQSTDGGATWTNVAGGGTGVNYSPGVLLPGTTQFRRVVTSGLCSSTSNAVSVTVQTSLSNYQISAAQTVCEGVAPALLDGQSPTGGTGNYTFVWESSPDGITWTVIAGATIEDYQPPVLTTSTYYRRTASGGLCPATSNPVLISVNPAPAGTITGPTGICSYQTADVTFLASLGTAPFTVQLKITAPGGGTSTLNQTVSSNGPATMNVLPLNSPAGTYTITLASITDSKGCSRTTGFTPVTIVVTAKPSVTVAAGASTICQGTSTTLTATGATSYVWSPATGLSAATGASLTADPATTTAYTVTGSTNGCTDTKTISITVIPKPAKPLVTAKVDYCMKAASVPLNATPATGNFLTWYTAYPLTGGTAATPIPSTAAATTNTYYVTQTNSNGCVSDTAIITVTVHPLPAVDFTLPGGICLPNGPASFTNKTTVADNSTLSYAWSFGDGLGASAAANPSYVYATSGSYAVKLKAVSSFGCTDSATKTLSSFFEKPIALFNVNPAELCQGQNNSFIDNSNPRGSTITKWWWDFGDGTATGTLKNPTHRYTRPGTYTVKLVVSTAIGCVSDTLPVTVVVHLQPKIDAGPSFVVPQGTTVSFQASANDTTVSLFWSPPAGLSNPATLRPTLIATQNQTYTLTAIGDFNCTATDTLTVRILKPLEIPNAFSPNGDGTNDTWLIPNLADYPGAKVEVFNRWGQQVFLTYGYNKPWDGTYLGKALPLATYYYIITLNNGFKPVAGSVTIIK